MKMTLEQISEYMRDCTLCPRKCHVNRFEGNRGFCNQTSDITAARAALHFWEEPCISGKKGSGAVFFSGCNLQCVFCQNHNIAIGHDGQAISPKRLSEIFLELQEKGANNINLVTAGHFLPQVIYALENAKSCGLNIPIVYNSSGYEEVASLRLLEGLVDIYLPDLKYQSSELSLHYSHTADYFAKASAAIAEMYRQVGSPVFSPDSGLMKKGVIVRHLLLPGQSGDSKRILRYLYNTYKNDIYVSIMNQYTPLPHIAEYPELNRKISASEYDKIISFAQQIGIENGFIQEGETASESFIPDFSGEGL